MKNALIVAMLLLLGVASRGPLTFVALDGSEVQLAATSPEATLILHFWATWCPTCKEDMRALDAASASCTEGAVTVVAVNVDEDVATIRKYWTDLGIDMRVVRDPGGDEWRRLGGTGLPFNWVGTGGTSRTLSGAQDAASWGELLAEVGCVLP